MLVLFSGSSRNIRNDIELYRRIINTIRKSGHAISHDWVETAWLMTQGKGRDGRGWDLRSIVMEVDAGIDAAEVVIVEASDVSTFGVGYEMATALYHHKNVLALVQEEKVKDSYAAAIKHDLLTVRAYTPKTLEMVIEEFLTKNDVHTKDLRFNFVMDRQIYNHLRNRSYKTGKTKAEIVRELLLNDITKSN